MNDQLKCTFVASSTIPVVRRYHCHITIPYNLRGTVLLRVPKRNITNITQQDSKNIDCVCNAHEYNRSVAWNKDVQVTFNSLLQRRVIFVALVEVPPLGFLDRLQFFLLPWVVWWFSVWWALTILSAVCWTFVLYLLSSYLVLHLRLILWSFSLKTFPVFFFPFLLLSLALLALTLLCRCRLCQFYFFLVSELLLCSLPLLCCCSLKLSSPCFLFLAYQLHQVDLSLMWGSL